MTNRALGFTALLAVIGVSIVFGMVVGGRLNAPQVMLAAPATAPFQLAQPVTAGTPPIDFADIVHMAIPAVVSVTSTQTRDERQSMDRQQRDEFFRWFFPDRGDEPERRPQQMPPRIGEGSGFIISPDGYILTNNHVVEDSSNVKVRLHGTKQYQAKVVGSDPAIDLALLKIDPQGARLPTLPLGDSDKMRVGEWVIAIGNPHEFEQTVTVGVISGKERRVPIGSTDQGVVNFIQTDAAINFGNSGGPLLDARGNVIGINTAIRRVNFAEGIGFALPINAAIRVMDQLRDQGYVRRGYIGITMNPEAIDEDARDYYGLPDAEGVIVSDVQPDGPAAKAGVKPGDIIRVVDGEKIKDNLHLISKVAARNPGDRVKLELLRAGKTVRVEATLVDRDKELQARTGNSERPAPRGGEDEEHAESTGLGLTVQGLTRRARESMGLDDDQRGVLVTEVDFESEAADKGIRSEMIVTAINDRPIADLSGWDRALAELKPGAPVKLTMLLPESDSDGRTFFVYMRVPNSKP